MRTLRNRLILSASLLLGVLVSGSFSTASEPDWTLLQRQFTELPIEARRLTGPLFWLHGDESPERLEMYLEKTVEGGNGTFTAESRPHVDWLGEGWYRDLDICLRAAKRHNLTMWIFDEKWWPSQMVGGKVPPEYGSKHLEATATSVTGPKRLVEEGYGGEHFVAAVAGKEIEGGIDGSTLVDLAGSIRGGTLTWDVPPGRWQLMKFTWEHVGGRRILVDGASRDSVDWFIRTVYQPHYDHFKEDFGKTIRGYFYDEPETHGDWGTEVRPVLEEMGVDWKKALVAWKFQLAGQQHVAARYAYHDAFSEAWGRTMYGGMSRWCREHGVISMGHFLEHGGLYLNMRVCAGNMFQLQKHSDMGGIDLVCRQMYPGQRARGIYQTPKLASSISHVYGKADDIAMCEIFGAYGQDVTYPQMKWLTDQMQVRGVNYMVPHSINPRSPFDRDCPPYFYNGGFEPRWPLYRVYADYTSRLSLLLAGGRHVCPVAFLFCGNSTHVGRTVTPEDMTSALQDVLFDCDWMPYEVFEGDAQLSGNEITLYRERYKILVVPPVEVIPYATLAKVKEFYDAGGIVVGYGFLPSKSATLGRTAAEIAALVEAIWGPAAQPALTALKTNAAGGRAYLLAQQPAPEAIQEALTGDAGVHPTLEVVEGETGHWLHVLHRVKSDRDVFLICNQNHQGDARPFTFRVTAPGEPECWDAMQNEITSIPFRRVGEDVVDVSLTLEPNESALLVFRPEARPLPARLGPDAEPALEPVPVVRDPVGPAPVPSQPALPDRPKFDGCTWVWFPEGNPAAGAPPATRYFRRAVSIPAGRQIKQARFLITADNDFTLTINAKAAGRSDRAPESWRRPQQLDVAEHLQPGANLLAIAAVNTTDEPSPAGLIGRLTIQFEEGPPLAVAIDKTWKASDQQRPGWQTATFDDAAWPQAKEIAPFGAGPWGMISGSGRITASPLVADPFHGRCTLPATPDLTKYRVYLEMDELPALEEAAAVTVNGRRAGGVIGRPFRVNVGEHLKAGENVIEIVPVAPKRARLVFYASP